MKKILVISVLFTVFDLLSMAKNTIYNNKNNIIFINNKISTNSINSVNMAELENLVNERCFESFSVDMEINIESDLDKEGTEAASDNGKICLDKGSRLKRMNSFIWLSELKDKDLLPPPMGTEEYIGMMEQFLIDNNQLISPWRWVLSLTHSKKLIENDLLCKNSWFGVRESIFRKISKNSTFQNGVKMIDVSCPSIINYAKSEIKERHKNKAKEGIEKAFEVSELIEDEPLTLDQLNWIICYFEKYLKKIQTYEICKDDKYDSGLSDEDIDLLVKLSVGENRVFGTSKMTGDEREKFINEGLKIMLQNASGFQRVLALLVASIINYETSIGFWHMDLEFLKGEGSSYKRFNRVVISESDDDSLDMSLFHEITHAYHQMIGMSHMKEEIISNISIVNSRDINLIDQYFPMLRPSVMNPVLDQIEEIINRYFGQDFSEITPEEREKLVILIMEPIVRNAMMSGFGNFMFPGYKEGQTLKMSVDLLTTDFMAKCVYLSSILNRTILYPIYAELYDVIGTPSNVISSFGEVIYHPVFHKAKIMAIPVTIKDEMLGEDSLWNDAEEKITMQGNSYLSLGNQKFYIQDRQNEHIYRIRARDDYTADFSPIVNHFRYHQEDEIPIDCAGETLAAMIICCTSLGVNIDAFYNESSVKSYIDAAFYPSIEEKYRRSNDVKKETNQKITVDENIFTQWLLALTVSEDNQSFKDLNERYENLRDALKKEAFAQDFSDDKINEIYKIKFKELEQKYEEITKNQLEQLFKNHVDINVSDKKGYTPLYVAVSNGQLEIIDLFLNNGADVNSFNDCGDNLIHCIYSLNMEVFPEILNVLIDKGVDINGMNIWGDTPLVYLAINDDSFSKEKIECMLKKGANINAQNYKGNSLLHILSFSSCLNKVDLWSFLIKKGANINAKNDLNETPLHIAVNNGISSNALENLLNLGADVKARTHEGKNALHYLVMGWDDRNNNPNFQLLGNLLVKKGLDVNSQDYKGDTPLHEIARKYRKSQSAIKFLLNNGAKIDIENGNNKIPLELAISKKSVNLKFFSDLSRQD